MFVCLFGYFGQTSRQHNNVYLVVFSSQEAFLFKKDKETNIPLVIIKKTQLADGEPVSYKRGREDELGSIGKQIKLISDQRGISNDSIHTLTIGPKQLQLAVRAELESGTSGFQVRRPSHVTTLLHIRDKQRLKRCHQKRNLKFKFAFF